MVQIHVAAVGEVIFMTRSVSGTFHALENAVLTPLSSAQCNATSEPS